MKRLNLPNELENYGWNQLFFFFLWTYIQINTAAIFFFFKYFHMLERSMPRIEPWAEEWEALMKSGYGLPKIRIYLSLTLSLLFFLKNERNFSKKMPLFWDSDMRLIAIFLDLEFAGAVKIQY